MKVVFKNKGEVDIRAIVTSGVSAKGSDAIGYFGTGACYSIAIILRLGGNITIHSGDAEYEFSVTTSTIRGKDFNIVTMNKKELGFTTELGRDWEPWMAVREVLCNAKDEGGEWYEIEDTEEVSPEEGTTMIVVDCPEFLEAYRKRSDFILDKEGLVAHTNKLEVYRNPTKSLFYKGVKVFTADKPFTHTYNFTKHIDLNEDRTLKYENYGLHHTLCGQICDITDNEYINKLVSCGEAYKEYSLSFSQGHPNQELVARVRRNSGKVDNKVPRQLALKCKPSLSEELHQRPTLPLDELQQTQMAKAFNFLQKLGLITEEYPVKVMDDLGEGILGLADRDNGVVYIAANTFNLGTKYLAGTMYEEYIHLKYGVDDETRGFQDHVINQLMSLGERLNKEPL